jgi:hypothetical protein
MKRNDGLNENNVSPCGVGQHANDDNVHVADDVSDWTGENLKSYFVKVKLNLTKE